MTERRMPFLGCDFRAPGNVWVKDNGGWERIVALRENLNRHIKKIAHERLLVKNWQLASEVSNGPNYQWNVAQDGDITNTPFWKNRRPTFRKLSPYMFLPKGAGKEHSAYFTIGEILLKFDFCSALHHLSRFQYVCRFVELVIQMHYSSLSGSALKALYGIVEEAVNVSMETKYDVNQVHGIIQGLIKVLQANTKNYIGGKAGWNCHYHIAHVWLNQLNNIQYEEREDGDGLHLNDLPDECLRQIFLRMQDCCDISHMGATNNRFHQLSNEWKLWRDFCQFHFSRDHLTAAIPKGKNDRDIDWKRLFKQLRTKHGMRQVYGDYLQLCCHCHCVFWMGGTHPCPMEFPPERGEREPQRNTAQSRDISPEQLARLFPTP